MTQLDFAADRRRLIRQVEDDLIAACRMVADDPAGNAAEAMELTEQASRLLDLVFGVPCDNSGCSNER